MKRLFLIVGMLAIFAVPAEANHRMKTEHMQGSSSSTSRGVQNYQRSIDNRTNNNLKGLGGDRANRPECGRSGHRPASC
jgi:hypothetical protein